MCKAGAFFCIKNPRTGRTGTGEKRFLFQVVFFAKIFADTVHSAPEQHRQDMVGPAVFLASNASDFVNGQILYADGGILAYLGRQPQ